MLKVVYEEHRTVLSTEDRAFWDENGYIVVQDVIPQENIKAAEDAVWDFLDMRSDDSRSWYPDPPRRGIMAEMYQHQALWDNRQSPRVHQAFAEILGTERLWVSIDRVSMSPPERTSLNNARQSQEATASTAPIPSHWDYALQLHGDGTPTILEGSTEPPVPFWVQGVLYLTDTAANGGAFTCVPGFHRHIDGWLEILPGAIDPRRQDRDGPRFRNFDAWLKTLPAGADLCKRDIMSINAKTVSAKAGDLTIWHSSLPHGVSTGLPPWGFLDLIEETVLFSSSSSLLATSLGFCISQHFIIGVMYHVKQYSPHRCIHPNPLPHYLAGRFLPS